MKYFNTAGTCFPDRHYMVDITERLAIIKQMIDRGDYFCINRGRQYGKTTTLNYLQQFLSNEYSVFRISFEGLGDSVFSTVDTCCYTVLKLMANSILFEEVNGICDEAKALIQKTLDSHSDRNIPADDFGLVTSLVCKKNHRPLVLLIDEVDQAGNWDSFIKFLGGIRNLFLNRNIRPTFQSVVLAGVYDIKNLKLKIRNENEHQYNSPWNIAVPFDVDMSFSPKDISTMLTDFENDHHTGMDIQSISEMIYEYTEGYPFLVSRMCQILEKCKEGWNREGILAAERVLLNEKNTLFDDMIKKLDQFPEAYKILYDVIIKGEAKTFNVDDKGIDLLRMFNFIKNDNGKIAMANRLFETRLTNLFISQQNQTEKMLDKGATDKPMFIEDDKLNMRLILERFSEIYTSLYSERDESFDEDEGRKKFLFYIKPIINGTGNYYMESETRNRRRTDLIIDYLGHQYIIEMKIWNGRQYNIKGEKQLTDYLTSYGLKEGYMLTFNFNKNKKSGITESIIGDKKIIEAVV